MKTVVQHDTVVSPNLTSGDISDVSVYPSSCCVGGSVICIYRRGTAKHSRDGVLWAQSSIDGGKSWLDPVVIFDGMRQSVPESVHTGVVCEYNGVAIAFFTTVEAKQPDSYIFSQEGRELLNRVYMCRSNDGGRSWNNLIELKFRGRPRNTYLAGRPLTLPDGRLLIPVEATGEYGQQVMMGCFYEDGGPTVLPLFDIAHDVTGMLGFGDGKFTLLHDSQILMHIWTYLNKSEETVCIHRCVSSDAGRTWSQPEPTNIACQIMSPLSLSDGSLIAVGNVREMPEGIRLFRSVDGGVTWIGTPIQLWDARKLQLTAVPLAIGMAQPVDHKIWNELPSFTFGSPELTMLADWDILLTYYALVNDVTHVRACRFLYDNRSILIPHDHFMKPAMLSRKANRLQNADATEG